MWSVQREAGKARGISIEISHLAQVVNTALSRDRMNFDLAGGTDLKQVVPPMPNLCSFPEEVNASLPCRTSAPQQKTAQSSDLRTRHVHITYSVCIKMSYRTCFTHINTCIFMYTMHIVSYTHTSYICIGLIL